jgi:hypothetical protein
LTVRATVIFHMQLFLSSWPAGMHSKP